MTETLGSPDVGEKDRIEKLPDKTYQSTQGEFKLQRYFEGYRAIIVFYPEDQSPVCSNQLGIYSTATKLFAKYQARIVAISVDDPKSHREFAESLNLTFPLISDHDPEGELARMMGVYDEEADRSQRAIFVYDLNGDLYWSMIYPDTVNPGAEGILKALDELEELDR